MDIVSENYREVIIGGINYKMGLIGPWILGQVINWLKDKRRKEVIADAKEVGITDLKVIFDMTSRPLSRDDIDEGMREPDAKLKMVYFALKIWQDIDENLLNKNITIEQANVLTNIIMEGLPESNPTIAEPETEKIQ